METKSQPLLLSNDTQIIVGVFLMEWTLTDFAIDGELLSAFQGAC